MVSRVPSCRVSQPPSAGQSRMSLIRTQPRRCLNVKYLIFVAAHFQATDTGLRRRDSSRGLNSSRRFPFSGTTDCRDLTDHLAVPFFCISSGVANARSRYHSVPPANCSLRALLNALSSGQPSVHLFNRALMPHTLTSRHVIAAADKKDVRWRSPFTHTAVPTSMAASDTWRLHF